MLLIIIIHSITQNDEEYNVNICINNETMENIPFIPNGRNKYDKIILCTC